MFKLREAFANTRGRGGSSRANRRSKLAGNVNTSRPASSRLAGNVNTSRVPTSRRRTSRLAGNI
jgi:hypothetical protein